MQTATGTVLASVTQLDKDQRPWVAAQKAAGGVINSGRMSFNCNNGKIFKYYIDYEHFYNWKPSYIKLKITVSIFADLVSKGDDLTVDPASHTRNSSTNSQFSKGSGYESQNSQPVLNGQNLGYNLEKDKGPGVGLALADGHSRQSSSGGDSNCGR